MSKVAIVCACGIGDALIMLIAAHALRSTGKSVTVFSQFLGELELWFPGFIFEKQPTEECVKETLAPFDVVFLQHDNSPKAKGIRALPKPVYSFYGSHQVFKHGALRPGFDFVCDPTICMAENVGHAMQALFKIQGSDLNNGLVPPPGLIQHRFGTRVAIHPTSTSSSKNWKKNSFLKLKTELTESGWDPVFILPASEATSWDAPIFKTLSNLAAFLFESQYFIGNDSGPGHLASNVGLQTLTIGPSKQHLTFWKPGWCNGELVYPQDWVTKYKLTRPFWMNLISVNHVIKRFAKLTDNK